MKYLILDKNFEVVEKISTKELKRRANNDNVEAILLYENCLEGIVVEDNIFFDADKCKRFADSPKKRYFATYDGDFYSVDKKTDKKTKLEVFTSDGCHRINVAGNKVNATNLLAKLFIPGYTEDKFAYVVDKTKKLCVKNIRISDEKNTSLNKRVGKFDSNGNCIKEFNSITEAAKDSYYCPSYMGKMLNSRNDGVYRFI